MVTGGKGRAKSCVRVPEIFVGSQGSARTVSIFHLVGKGSW